MAKASGFDSELTKISLVLTGNVSKACIVKRNVLGCLSRDEGTRGGLHCAMSRGEERREGYGERMEGAGGRGRGGSGGKKGEEGERGVSRGESPKGGF